MKIPFKIAIIREDKIPIDRRVALSPNQCKTISDHYPEVELSVQSSQIRVFSDADYQQLGISLTDEVKDYDLLIGVKEVPIDKLIANKTYIFFSHTIKRQPYNRDLIRCILEKNITLLDYEGFTQQSGLRIIGFGYYAGVVGTYNAIMAWGMRTKSFRICRVSDFDGVDEMRTELAKVKLTSIKIALTGAGRVTSGILDVMKWLNITQVSPLDYLTQDFDEPVFTHLNAEDYAERKDGKLATREDYYENYIEYKSNFFRFAQVTDLYLAGHFHADGAPSIFTREDAKSSLFRIQLVADISCDIDGPVASTIRPSTIDNPLYGYQAQTGLEVPYDQDDAITVMAVDNLPCEFPRAASEGFGKEMINSIIPQLFNGDPNGILERATVTKSGKLTPRYAYLQDYVDGV